MQERSVLAMVRHADECFAVAENNLQEVRQTLDEIAQVLGYWRKEENAEVPYPGLTDGPATKHIP
jgi:hypothetical protein